MQEQGNYLGPWERGLVGFVVKKYTEPGGLAPSKTGSPPIRRLGPLATQFRSLISLKSRHRVAPKM